jgi:hypothetical protein
MLQSNHYVGSPQLNFEAWRDTLRALCGGYNPEGVADSSVMPSITTGHTLAPTLAIAERAAGMISAGSRH